jgi:hypothetical protein
MNKLSTNRFRLQKKHIAFFTIVPMLAATAFIQTTCPVCHGEGAVSSTGMEDVHIIKLEAKEISIFRAGCDTYRVYQYDITLTLENWSDHDAGGYVNLILVDYQTGRKLDDTAFTVVEIPSKMSVEHKTTTYFTMNAMVDQPNRTTVSAEVLKSNVPCKACAGTGRVALNSWALSKSLKDTFVDAQRVATPAIPPLWVQTEGQSGDY